MYDFQKNVHRFVVWHRSGLRDPMIGPPENQNTKPGVSLHEGKGGNPNEKHRQSNRDTNDADRQASILLRRS